MTAESKAARLAAKLQEDINIKGLRVGAFLGTKAQLQTAHAVAAGTVNEAVRLLQVRGFVEVKPGPRGGLFVADMANRDVLMKTLFTGQSDPEALASLVALQDALEVLVVVTAARNCTAEHAVAIERELQALREANGQLEMMHAMWEVDMAVARASGNEVFSTVYCDIVKALQRSTLWSNSPDPKMIERKLLHESIALAVIANDVENAQRAAHRHSPPSTQLPTLRPDSVGQLQANSRASEPITPRK